MSAESNGTLHVHTGEREPDVVIVGEARYVPERFLAQVHGYLEKAEINLEESQQFAQQYRQWWLQEQERRFKAEETAELLRRQADREELEDTSLPEVHSTYLEMRLADLRDEYEGLAQRNTELHEENEQLRSTLSNGHKTLAQATGHLTECYKEYREHLSRVSPGMGY